MAKQTKNNQKLYTITQAANILKVSTHTIRNWEREGKARASYRTPQGHRRFTKDDIKKLQEIQNKENTVVYVNSRRNEKQELKRHEQELNENIWNTKKMQESLKRIKTINIAAATLSLLTLIISTTLTFKNGNYRDISGSGDVLSSQTIDKQELEKICQDYNTEKVQIPSTKVNWFVDILSTLQILFNIFS